MAEELRQMQKFITQLKPVMMLPNTFFFSHELTVWISYPSRQLPCFGSS